MRVKRASENYSGGGGTTFYDSDMFLVILWNFKPEKVTEIQVKGEVVPRIRLAGVIPIHSDDDCIEQFTAEEVRALLKTTYNRGLRRGRQEKVEEMLGVLGLTGRDEDERD